MSKVSLIKSSSSVVSIKGNLNSLNKIGVEFFYPCAVAADPTSATWRNNHAPSRYTFVPNVGIYTRGPIRNMTSMFEGNTSFNEDISAWDVSRVLSMQRMFFGATAFNQDLKMWKVEHINNEPTDFASNASSWILPQPSWGIAANYFYAATVDVLATFKATFLKTNFGDKYYIHPNVGIVTTDKLTDMTQVFATGIARDAFNDPGITQWDTSSVTTFESTFQEASSFNQDIGSWDTSSATNMANMFHAATSFNQDIGGWDVSSVTNMYSMFRNLDYSETAEYAFNQDIGSWDVSSVTEMTRMFENSVSFNQDLSDWNVSLIPNEPVHFSYRHPTLTAFPTFYKPVWGTTGWDGVYRTYSMVGEATDPTSVTWRSSYAPSGYEFIPNVGIRSKGDLTSTQFMFNGNATFNADISSWDVSTVTNMNGMFKNATAFNQDISSWNVSNVTNMREMFHIASNFNQDISSWDVSNVTNMAIMFRATNAFHQNIGSWDVSSVTEMAEMFESTAINQDIGGWDVSSVTNMQEMFAANQVFNQDLSSWDVSNVTNSINFDQATTSWVLPKPSF